MEPAPRSCAFALRLLIGAICASCSVGLLKSQCPDTGTLLFDGVTAVKGKPFQAKELTTILRYSPDGSKQAVMTKSNLFRDNQGRSNETYG
jgi:hypothetical protein